MGDLSFFLSEFWRPFVFLHASGWKLINGETNAQDGDTSIEKFLPYDGFDIIVQIPLEHFWNVLLIFIFMNPLILNS